MSQKQFDIISHSEPDRVVRAKEQHEALKANNFQFNTPSDKEIEQMFNKNIKELKGRLGNGRIF